MTTRTKPRTVGSLTHSDFGSLVKVPGEVYGVLWGIQHVGAIGDIPKPWTRLTVQHDGRHSESTRGLPPETAVTVTANEA